MTQAENCAESATTEKPQIRQSGASSHHGPSSTRPINRAQLPLMIMAAIPFSLVGILPAHAAMGAFFTATSMIGFIAGAGIVVRNSIILVDFIELRLKQGMALDAAVIDAGAVRFRPMMLTAAAVIAACRDSRPPVADYTTADITLRSRWGASPWQFALTVRNLFDAEAREPSPSPGLVPNDFPQPGRGVRGACADVKLLGDGRGRDHRVRLQRTGTSVTGERNGRVRQCSGFDDLVWTVPEIVHEMSRLFALRAMAESRAEELTHS